MIVTAQNSNFQTSFTRFILCRRFPRSKSLSELVLVAFEVCVRQFFPHKELGGKTATEIGNWGSSMNSWEIETGIKLILLRCSQNDDRKERQKETKRENRIFFEKKCTNRVMCRLIESSFSLFQRAAKGEDNMTSAKYVLLLFLLHWNCLDYGRGHLFSFICLLAQWGKKKKVLDWFIVNYCV